MNRDVTSVPLEVAPSGGVLSAMEVHHAAGGVEARETLVEGLDLVQRLGRLVEPIRLPQEETEQELGGHRVGSLGEGVLRGLHRTTLLPEAVERDRQVVPGPVVRLPAPDPLAESLDGVGGIAPQDPEGLPAGVRRFSPLGGRGPRRLPSRTGTGRERPRGSVGRTPRSISFAVDLRHGRIIRRSPPGGKGSA